MKKFIVSLIGVVSTCSVVLAGQSSSSVGPAPVLLVPAPMVQATNTYAWSQSNTFVAGAAVFFSSNIYVTPYGGASTGVVSPTATVVGDLTGPDGVLWRPILGRDRTGMIIANEGTNKVYIGTSSNSTGVAIQSSAVLVLDNCSKLQDAIWCRGMAGSTSTVSVLEY